MAFADPLVLPVSGVTPDLSLARVGQGNMQAMYRSVDGLWLFDIQHRLSRQAGSARVNTNVHFEFRKPKEETPSDYHSMHLRVILDRPEALTSGLGFTEAEIDKFIGRIATYLGTSGNVTKLISLQS